MSTDEALFNQILEQSKRPEFSSLVTVDENERQDIQEFVQELKQREEYYSNCDVEHLGQKLLDRDEMSFLTKQLSLTCPHIPRFSQIIAAFDYVMPKPIQSISYTDDLYGKALKDLSYLIQDEFLFTQSEDYPLDNIVARSSDLESSSLSTMNDSAREGSQALPSAHQQSASQMHDNQLGQSAEEIGPTVAAAQTQQADDHKEETAIEPLSSTNIQKATQATTNTTEAPESTSESQPPTDGELAVDPNDSPTDLRTPVVVTEPRLVDDNTILNDVTPIVVNENKTVMSEVPEHPAEIRSGQIALEPDGPKPQTILTEVVQQQHEVLAEESVTVSDQPDRLILEEPDEINTSPADEPVVDDELAPTVTASDSKPLSAVQERSEYKTSGMVQPNESADLQVAETRESSITTQNAPAIQQADQINSGLTSDNQPNELGTLEPQIDQGNTDMVEMGQMARESFEAQMNDTDQVDESLQQEQIADVNAQTTPRESTEEPEIQVTPPTELSQTTGVQPTTKIKQVRSPQEENDNHFDMAQDAKKSTRPASANEQTASPELQTKLEKTPEALNVRKRTPEPKTDEQTSTPSSRGRTLTLFNGVGPEACSSGGMDWRLEQLLRRQAQMCLTEASMPGRDSDTPRLEMAKFEVSEESDANYRAITARHPRRSGSNVMQRAESCPPDWCREVFEKAEKRRYQRSSSETRRHWNPLICADMTSEWRRDRLRKAANRKASPNYNDSPNGNGLYQFDSHLQEVYEKIKSRRLKKTLVQDEGYQLSKQVPDREDLRTAGPKSPPAHLLSRLDSSSGAQTNTVTVSPSRESTKDDAENPDCPSRGSSNQVSPPRIMVSPTRAAAALAVLQGAAPVIPSFNGDIATAPTKVTGTGAPRRKPKPVLVAATATTESDTKSPEIKDFRNILKKTGRLETVLKKSAGAGAVRPQEVFEDGAGATSGSGAGGQVVTGEKRAQLIQDQPVRPSDVRALFEKKARENDASGADEKEWWLKQVHKYNKR